MVVRCDRCGRAFRNKYAVWGHLRACRPGSVEAELAQPGLEPQLGEELADQKHDLRRRRLELERRELEREEDAAWHRDMEALNTRIESETETQRRRGIVEEVCSPFADLPYTFKGYQIPPGTCDAAKRRAHEELMRAGRGRSREELVTIVRQAREQVYAPVLKAQDDARAARAVAEREAHLAREREEAERREQTTISALPQGLATTDRFVEDRELTDSTDDDHETEDDAEDDLDFEDEPDGTEGDDDDEPDGDTESENEEEPAPVGLGGTLLKLGAIALGLVVLSRALGSSKVWIADPHHGGDGSFAVGGAPPGPQPPWREASETEIQQGLQDGALRRV